VPATSLNLASHLDHQARLAPDRLAIVCRPAALTYRELAARVNQTAGALRSLGLGPGDHIALSCPNTPHFPIAYYAILKIGAVVVPVNVLFKPREIAELLRDSDAKAMLVFEGAPELPMAAMARAARDDAPSCREMIVMTIDPAAPSPIEGVRTLGQIARGQSISFATEATSPDDTAVILYTSGTTGRPRGAELTHLNMTLNAIASRDMLMPVLDPGLDAVNVTLITLPLFHSTGQSAQMNASMVGGWTSVLLPRFDPAAVLRAFDEERVSCWVGVPTMFWALLQVARKEGVDVTRIAASLRCTVSGGAPMPPAVLEEFERTFGVRVLEGYGLSETSPVACFNQIHRPSKPGTVGLPVVSCDIIVVDDQDRPLPVGERGEVAIRGHNVMKGYYKRPEETAQALRNGWLHTGDIGVFDEDGYLTIVDRKKDLILRGGMNVYPREIEDVLMTHPAVSLAAVAGMPDERLGEEIKTFVVLRPGASLSAEELIAWSRERMAAFKYPRHVEFRETLPMGATGKVLKRAL
jgi:long-chain acyl-CoA synthetase